MNIKLYIFTDVYKAIQKDLHPEQMTRMNSSSIGFVGIRTGGLTKN